MGAAGRNEGAGAGGEAFNAVITKTRIHHDREQLNKNKQQRHMRPKDCRI